MPEGLDPKKLFPFPLDDFQMDAIASIDAGRSVIVCAPTGAGKTAIAEYAVHLALSLGLRCFYTTPLKALSNQKFFDFRASLGPHKVGLLTGDISVQRDAPVVVMTTEVFRNMLYGTTLGEVSRNLERVRFVILDECHFMNDVERGTVWEESIIYAPPGLQLVALSATIANAEDLREWMTQSHATTDLSISYHRPVPLRHYFFVRNQLHRLLDKEGRLNPALVGITGPPQHGTFQRRGRGFAGSRERGPGQAPQADIRDVCDSLHRRRMLPAIFFVFSRKGCEEALRRCDGTIGLTREERAELETSIDEAIAQTPALGSHPHLPYLYEGMAAHHAGLLPSWKSLVERLFQRGLVKAVFATETLAAGINMPARTTVISAISKRADEGHRTLTASEFLQMSGRAGRRGMDEVGNVVIMSHSRESAEEAARLARAKADPLVSQFTPSYGMVLNLLQRHTPADCYALLERSFGQFLANRSVSGLGEGLRELDAEIDRLSHPLCPDLIGDLPRYHGIYEQLRAIRKQIKGMQRGRERGGGEAGGGPGPIPSHPGRPAAPGRMGNLDEAIDGMKERAATLLADAKAMPCHGCPAQQPCSRQEEDLRRLHNRRAELMRKVRRASTPYRQQFENLSSVLREAGYLADNVPTASGRMAAALRSTNVLFLTEVIRSGVLDALHPDDAAAVLTAVITEETRRMEPVGLLPSEVTDDSLRDVVRVARVVDLMQRKHEVDVPVVVNPVYAGLSQVWAEGASWEKLRGLAAFDEGDLVRCLRRTIDLARQVARAPQVPQATARLCVQVEELLSRDEVREEFLAGQVPQEVIEEMEAAAPIPPIGIVEEMIEEDLLVD